MSKSNYRYVCRFIYGEPLETSIEAESHESAAIAFFKRSYSKSILETREILSLTRQVKEDFLAAGSMPPVVCDHVFVKNGTADPLRFSVTVFWSVDDNEPIYSVHPVEVLE